MARKVPGLLWKLHDNTANEICDSSGSEQSEIDRWLDEQSALTAAYAKDLATAVRFLEQELSARGISLRTH